MCYSSRETLTNILRCQQVILGWSTCPRWWWPTSCSWKDKTYSVKHSYRVLRIMCCGIGPRIFSIITRCSRFSWVCEVKQSTLFLFNKTNKTKGPAFFFSHWLQENISSFVSSRLDRGWMLPKSTIHQSPKCSKTQSGQLANGLGIEFCNWQARIIAGSFCLMTHSALVPRLWRCWMKGTYDRSL